MHGKSLPEPGATKRIPRLSKAPAPAIRPPAPPDAPVPDNAALPIVREPAGGASFARHPGVRPSPRPAPHRTGPRPEGKGLMPAGITSSDSMFSVRETPWHGLGAVLDRVRDQACLCRFDHRGHSPDGCAQVQGRDRPTRRGALERARRLNRVGGALRAAETPTVREDEHARSGERLAVRFGGRAAGFRCLPVICDGARLLVPTWIRMIRGRTTAASENRQEPGENTSPNGTHTRIISPPAAATAGAVGTGRSEVQLCLDGAVAVELESGRPRAVLTLDASDRGRPTRPADDPGHGACTFRGTPSRLTEALSRAGRAASLLPPPARQRRSDPVSRQRRRRCPDRAA
jgi:hypothetical protein